MAQLDIQLYMQNLFRNCTLNRLGVVQHRR